MLQKSIQLCREEIYPPQTIVSRELDEGFSFRYTWDGKNWNEKKIPKFRDTAYVDVISIFADIILKSFYCSAKVQLWKSLLCDMERELGRNLYGATAMKGKLIVVLCTQNKFNIIRFIIITSCQHKVYLSWTLWYMEIATTIYGTGPRFLRSPFLRIHRKNPLRNFLGKEK